MTAKKKKRGLARDWPEKKVSGAATEGFGVRRDPEAKKKN